MALSKRGAPTRNLVAFCEYVLSKGGRVTEMPPYGPVTKGAHSPGSSHYDVADGCGQAADINFGVGGSSSAERDALVQCATVAQSMGLGVIYSLHGHVAGHDTHLHADTASYSSLGQGVFLRKAGDIVPWDTQAVVHAGKDNLCGAETTMLLEAVKAASARHGVTFPHGVEVAQRAVGTKQDGVWGAGSRAAHDRTVNALEKVWKPAGLYAGAYDVIWGAGMDSGLSSFLKAYKR